MKPIVVIQARMGSSRLPGKAMFPLDGTPAIVHEIRRSARVDGIDRESVVVATSDRSRDDVLENVAREAGASVFRGPEEDVLGRNAAAVAEMGADVAVRLCGDNTLVSPALLSHLKALVTSEGVAYATSKYEHTFPIGHNADAFTAETIGRAANRAESDYHREHVAQFFKDRWDDIDAVNVRAEEVFDREFVESIPSFHKLRLTLDEADDYRLLARVYREVQYDTILDTRDAIEYTVEHDLRGLNDEVEQQVW